MNTREDFVDVYGAMLTRARELIAALDPQGVSAAMGQISFAYLACADVDQAALAAMHICKQVDKNDPQQKAQGETFAQFVEVCAHNANYSLEGYVSKVLGPLDARLTVQ